jgi:alanine racemase
MTAIISIFDILRRDCWVNIHAAQLTQNLRLLEAHIKRPVLVAIKGNAYGHGYEIAAKAFLAAGAKYLGVTNLAEGLLIRQIGITTPVLILGGILPHDMAAAASAGLEFIVFRHDHLQALREIPKTANPIRVHLKIDTGMGRLGCLPYEAIELSRAIISIPGVHLAGLSTHFGKASAPNHQYTKDQIEKFDETIASMSSAGIKPDIIHAANSSGMLNYRHARYDMVRIGSSAYGIRSSDYEDTQNPPGVAPALSWHARITSSKIIPINYKIGDGCEHTMAEDGRIGVLPVGYVDGYRRIPKNVNTVLVHGRECPIRGRVGIDQCLVDLEGFPDITGEEVVLLGKQGNTEITANDLAKRWRESNRGIYFGITMRVPRRVI